MKIENRIAHDSPFVKLRYFASLRDAVAKEQETIVLEVNTAKELFGVLKERYRFALALEDMRVAINGKFASQETCLSDGDEVVFIPPVSGG